MREEFKQMLQNLHEALIAMGALCESAIEISTSMIIERKNHLAERVFALEEKIDQKQTEVEAICTKLLIRQQPVAKDLRMVTAALRMVTDMERIGDQAADIAEISKYISYEKLGDIYPLQEMSKVAIKMVNDSIDSFVTQDLSLAHQVMVADDTVDSYFIDIKKKLFLTIQTQKPESECVLDLLMIAKYLERIADHAVNVAEWVEYSITGKTGE